MSNPSQEKAPALQSEQAKEDPRGILRQTSEQQTENRLHDAVYQARTEPKPSVETKQTTPSAKNTDNSELKEQPPSAPKDKSTILLKSSIESNWLIDSNDNRYKIEKLGTVNDTSKDSTQDGSGAAYPKVQMSHDADGKLDHIDFKSHKDR